jgi:virginiamycin B lyase
MQATLRAFGRWLILLALLTLVAAARAQTSDLPEGEGKRILESACTTCHDLTEVTKFRGFYTKDEWRDVVETMVKYGAELKAPEVDVLVEYLDKNLGKK